VPPPQQKEAHEASLPFAGDGMVSACSCDVVPDPDLSSSVRGLLISRVEPCSPSSAMARPCSAPPRHERQGAATAMNFLRELIRQRRGSNRIPPEDQGMTTNDRRLSRRSGRRTDPT